MSIAVVPARGGSKRIPRKNIRAFNGEPIIAIPLRTALASALFDDVVVSTDDPEIAAFAESLGARVPFLRPAALADDFAGTVAVVAHTISALREESVAVSDVCCIYPTAVFTSAEDLEAGHKLLRDGHYDYVLSATEFRHAVQRGFELDEPGALRMLAPEHTATRSQDLTPVFHDAGQWYWGRAESWLAQRPLLSERSLAYRVPRRYCVDIDTEEDWRIAEVLYRALTVSEAVH